MYSFFKLKRTSFIYDLYGIKFEIYLLFSNKFFRGKGGKVGNKKKVSVIKILFICK